MFVSLWSLILLSNHRSPAELPGHRDAPRSHPSLPTVDERTPGARPQDRAGTGTSPGTLVCVCDVYGFQKITTLRGCLLPKPASAGNHLPEKQAVQEAHAHRTCLWVWGPGCPCSALCSAQASPREARSPTLGGRELGLLPPSLATPQPQAGTCCLLATHWICRQCFWGQHGARLAHDQPRDGGRAWPSHKLPYPRRMSGRR